MSIFQRFRNFLENRRLQHFLENVHAWYRICSSVNGLCDEALNDPEMCKCDIVEMIDQADTDLFILLSRERGTQSYLRRNSPKLAQRLDKISENIYKLRNETVRYLIRCQGPGSFVTEQALSEAARSLYYYRALEEVGFSARRFQEQVDRELKTLWADMQAVIGQVERQLALGTPV